MTGTFWQRLTRGICKSRHRPDWAVLAGEDWPRTIMAAEPTEDFHAKQGRSTGRLVVRQGGVALSVYLKRHYRLPWWRGVAAALWPAAAWSPALSEERHLRWATDNGLSVPRVAASAEYVGPWFRLRSVLVIEELVGMLPLHLAVPLARETLPRPVFEQWKRGLVRELARVARELHGRHHFHKDLYLCHFYLPRADIEAWAQPGGPRPGFAGRLHLIDLHRLARHRWTRPVWLVKDLAELLFSSELDGVTPRDRVRFWRHYRAGARRTWATRLLESWVRVKWRRYRDHNRKKEERERQRVQREGRAA